MDYILSFFSHLIILRIIKYKYPQLFIKNIFYYSLVFLIISFIFNFSLGVLLGIFGDRNIAIAILALGLNFPLEAGIFYYLIAKRNNQYLKLAIFYSISYLIYLIIISAIGLIIGNLII
jgi:hypothetical protein